MQEKKDLEIKGLQTKIDELHAKIEKQNDTINILIAENKELEARLDVLDPLQLPPVGDVLQKKIVVVADTAYCICACPYRKKEKQ
ncbi:hypothetical protein ACMSE9_11515 [Bacteroides thetaiotaomicron]|uniref:hypothetical protein n=1 Tax=Bacteroides thetaiotaomicron TaxID=818 RepID=UPI0039C1D779